MVAVGFDLVTNRANLCSWRFSGTLFRDLGTVRGVPADSPPVGVEPRQVLQYVLFCFSTGTDSPSLRHEQYTTAAKVWGRTVSRCLFLEFWPADSPAQTADIPDPLPRTVHSWPADSLTLCCLLGFGAFRGGLGLVVSRGSRCVSGSST